MANVNDLCSRIAKRLKVPKRAVRVVVDELFLEIEDELSKEQPVVVRGFGRWYYTYQDFDDDYFRRRGRIPEGVVDPKLKLCRFKFVERVRTKLNGIEEDVGVETSDPRRLDYKKRGVIERLPEIREAMAGEAERRARAGITMGEIIKRMREEEGVA